MTHPTATPPSPPGLRDLADDEVPDFLDAHRVAVLAFVDLSTEASRTVDERLQRVAFRFTDQAEFARVDVRRHPLVADALGVRRVPEVVVFVRGASADRIAGLAPEDVLADAVRTHVARRSA